MLVTSKQLSLNRKRELAADLQAGITESEAVAKYRTSKGTVGRVRRDVHRYLNLDVDALGEDRKRELKVGLDAQMANFLHRNRAKSHCNRSHASVSGHVFRKEDGFAFGWIHGEQWLAGEVPQDRMHF